MVPFFPARFEELTNTSLYLMNNIDQTFFLNIGPSRDAESLGLRPRFATSPSGHEERTMFDPHIIFCQTGSSNVAHPRILIVVFPSRMHHL